MAPKKRGGLRTKIATSTGSSSASEGLKSLRYEETLPAKLPIPVTIVPPRAPPMDTHPALRRPDSGTERQDVSKRDSGLAPTESTAAREGSMTAGDESSLFTPASSSLAHTNGAITPETPKTPNMTKSDSSSTASRWGRGNLKKGSSPKIHEKERTKTVESSEQFSPLTTSILTEGQLELDFMDQISFSNRGSVLLSGKKVHHARPMENTRRRQPSLSTMAASNSTLLTEELEMESQKVRSMYEIVLSTDWTNLRLCAPEIVTSKHEQECVAEEPNQLVFVTKPENNIDRFRPSGSHNLFKGNESHYRNSYLTTGRASFIKLEHELAGGLEDWEDINGEDVDRYGFIVRKENANRAGSPEPRPPQRISTVLQVASRAPRRRHGFGRTLSSSKSSRSGLHRNTSRKVSSLRSISTHDIASSRRSSSRTQPFRSAANRLPGNRDRRWMDEAGDMLTLPPGLADIAEEVEGVKVAEGAKRKEWDRAEKWRKMAKVVKSGKEGEGMQFEFDVRNPKLIERTWKGIPDRWRAAAWHSFLSASAKRRKDSTADSQIVEDFHSLIEKSSADDVQIDMDVPRTINSHIMFRRRYRGGQRLLFRVLHALSLYFPETGYVQGMASLAATLLCYYDEEMTFVMLVRMWQLRGLDKLYESGFPGLMAALDEFKKEWLGGHEVSKKLDDLGIEPTAFGTRWYLTLFNYSIPFPAQLRVWDVFMLLGDSDMLTPSNKDRPFSRGLDVLHAASAALIDGTRDIVLESDFENAMKALTSWIPVKDEDLFMKVARAEWKIHHTKKRT